MFAVIDEVCADLLEATRRISFVAAIPESIIFMELGQLESGSIHPQSVTTLVIKLLGMGKILGTSYPYLK